MASFGDAIAVNHIVKPLALSHSLDCSTNVVALVREVKYCILGVAGLWATTTILRSWLEHRSAVYSKHNDTIDGERKIIFESTSEGYGLMQQQTTDNTS